MSWKLIYYGVGTVVAMVLIYYLFKEFGKIAREQEDYDDKVDLPD